MNTESSTQHIAGIFKATRKFNRLQQTELAAVLEVTQGTISKIESGNMPPDLTLWFKFLKAFQVTDPYCFTYGGVEFPEKSIQTILQDGSPFLPLFNYKNDKTIFNVKSIRPIVDFFMKNHSKTFEDFLKSQKIGIEVFYILNHPLTFKFADTLFSFLQEHKINSKSLALLDLNFEPVYGAQAANLLHSNNPDLFFELLNNEHQDLYKYKLNSKNKSYTVSLNKKNQSLMDDLNSKDLICTYNLLYPYHFLKSIKQCRTTPPTIVKLKNDLEWQVNYAS